MPMIYKFCPTCETRYGTFNVTQKYCSNRCRQRAYRLGQAVITDKPLTITLGETTLKFVNLPAEIDRAAFEARLLELLAQDGLLETITHHDPVRNPLPDIRIN